MSPNKGSSAATALAIHPSGVLHRWRWLRRKLVPYVFIAPFILLFGAFFVAPIGYAVHQALFSTQRSGLGLGPPTEVFVGLANFRRAFTDPAFLSGLRRVLAYAITQIPLMLGFALLLALLLDAPRQPFRRFYRLAFFVPFAVPGVIAALLWGFLYGQTSPIVDTVEFLGLGRPNLLSSSAIFWSIVNIGLWGATGYFMVIMYSALQTVPQDLVEAARVDGCGEIGVAWHIKVPLVAPAIVVAGLFSIIGALQLFNEPRALQAISGTISSSYTPNLYAYNVAFANSNFGYAAAIAVVLAVFTAVFSLIFLVRAQRRVNR